MPRKIIKVDEVYKQLEATKIPLGWLNIFVGPNNSGKSQILKFLMDRPSKLAINDSEIDYVGPDRFNVTNDVTVSSGSYNQLSSGLSQRRADDVNRAERIPIDTTHELVLKLKDKDKDRLLEWHKKYFGNLEIKKTDEENRDSPRKIEVDGQPLSVQGTGSRAVLAILVKLFDPTLKALCIDEPELSIEPKTQRKLFEIIKSIASRKASGLPKKKIFIATHSHLFIDKEKPSNNYKVEKINNQVIIKSIKNKEELANVTFNLLGNSPGDIFLPSNFLIVSGISDKIFFDSILNIINSKNKRVMIHYAEGDQNILFSAELFEQMLKFLNYSPYKKSVCVLIDKQNTPKISLREIRNILGDNGTRVVELGEGAIEFYYPKGILKKVSGIRANKLSIKKYLKTLSTDAKKKGFGNAEGRLGKFKGGKKKLAEAVAQHMTSAYLSKIDKEIINILNISLDKALE